MFKKTLAMLGLLAGLVAPALALGQSVPLSNRVHVAIINSRPTEIGDQEPAASAMYSVRQLRVEYLGPIINLRCSTGPKTADWYPNQKGDINQALILAWCPAGTITVPKWYDQSGNGNDSPQATSANQPQLVINSVNGKPSLNYDGTTSYLTLPANVKTALLGASLTTLMVSKLATGGPSVYVGVMAVNTGSATAYTGPTVSGIGSNWTGKYWNGSGNNGLTGTIASVAGTPVLIGFNQNGANLSVTVNNVQTASASDAAAASGFSGINAAYIGSNGTQSRMMKGAVPEVLIFSGSLSAANMAAYLANSRSYYGF